MQKFKVGAYYGVNDGKGGVVRVEKRTARFITVSGDYSGRYAIRAHGDRGLFGLGEHLLIGKRNLFCFAGREIPKTW